MSEETRTLSSLIVASCTALEREYEGGHQLLSEIETELHGGGDPFVASSRLRGVLDRVATHDQELRKLRERWTACPRQADQVLESSVASLKKKIHELISRIDLLLGKAQQMAAKLQPQVAQGTLHRRMRSAYAKMDSDT